MSKEAILLKSKLVKTRNVIAKKFRQSQIDRIKHERAIGQTFAPVIKKIGKMMNKSAGENHDCDPDSDTNNNSEESDIAEMASEQQQQQPEKRRLYRKKVAKVSNKNRKTRDRRSKTVGSGRFQAKSFIPYNSNIVYEYYDDPNELCDRMRLLMASQAAGNSNHNQEINSIIEELHERNIIQMHE